ncbi:MAG: pyridoxal phosphate-dependent aminotransferase [Planctomycetota bacterium]
MKTTSPPGRLSQRARNLKPSATFAVNARVQKLLAQGLDVIGFGVGEPDFDTPAQIKQSAIDALLAGQTHYMPVAGEPRAREAIADKLRRENGLGCTADQIVISAGAKHSIYLALQCLLDPGRGQEVILPTPAWVSYRPMIELAGGTVVEVPGPLENDFKITPRQLEQAISDRSAALIINSPSNPCGTMYSPDELRDLAAVLEPHDRITVVTDEIYEKLVYGDVGHFSLGSIEALAPRVVTVNGLSKAYAMTGWRIGYACAPAAEGGESLAKAMAKLQGQMTSNITSFCYAAITEALASGAAAVQRMREVFAERARIMHERLLAMPGVRCPRPSGAFYVFPDISAHFGKRSGGGHTIDSSLTFAEALLDEAQVAVVPGADFGAGGDRHVRLSFACSTDLIEEGCRRIDAWLGAVR